MATRQVGIWLGEESDAKLVELSREMGWSKSETVRRLLQTVTITRRPALRVQLEPDIGDADDD